MSALTSHPSKSRRRAFGTSFVAEPVRLASRLVAHCRCLGWPNLLGTFGMGATRPWAIRPSRTHWVACAAWLLAFAGLGAIHEARGHELSVDELRWWIPPGAAQLRGQLTFDPELTRARDAPVPDAVARERILAFVQQQLDVVIDGRRCALAAEVRELYEVGGAAPGDVVVLSCPLGPAVESLSIGVGVGFPELLVQVAGLEAATGQTLVVRGGSRSNFARNHPAIEPAPSSQGHGRLASLAAAFLRTGIMHVLPQGFDHLLFVVGLTLSAYPNWRRLLWLVGTFTLAHTLTLALAAAGIIAPSPELIEPLITASIAVTGFAGWRTSARGPATRGAWALPLAFGFGLIHGLGFAGALTPLQLPATHFWVAVVAFNCGVELAQLAVVTLTLALLFVLSRRGYALARGHRFACLTIGLIGVIWTLLRVAA